MCNESYTSLYCHIKKRFFLQLKKIKIHKNINQFHIKHIIFNVLKYNIQCISLFTEYIYVNISAIMHRQSKTSKSKTRIKHLR